MQVFLGIDVGKTGLRAGVFDTDTKLIARWVYPAAKVDRALAALELKLLELRRAYDVAAAGVCIFGPLQVNPARPAYGSLIGSSEPAWSGVNVPQIVCRALAREVWFDFDVNAGALAEATLGNGKGLSRFVYLSVGTGVGAVAYVDAHRPGYAPQIGHVYVPREPDDALFAGSCRFHGACLQGLASGRALAARWGLPAEMLPPGHAAWDLEARYLARACANLIYCFAPEAILLGSSVGSAPALSIPDVNRYAMALLNDFIEPELRERYSGEPAVVRSAFGPDCSLIGAAVMASREQGLRFGS